MPTHCDLEGTPIPSGHAHPLCTPIPSRGHARLLCYLERMPIPRRSLPLNLFEPSKRMPIPSTFASKRAALQPEQLRRAKPACEVGVLRRRYSRSSYGVLTPTHARLLPLSPARRASGRRCSWSICGVLNLSLTTRYTLHMHKTYKTIQFPSLP